MPQDFSRQNLRGHSFKGQNLNAADFSGADIRGANFTHAKLIGANFRGAKAGLQRRSCICLVIFSLLLMVVSGFTSAICGAWVASLFRLSFSGSQFAGLYNLAGVVSLIVLAVFLIFTIYQGVVAAFGLSAVAVVIAGVLAVAVAVTVPGTIGVAVAVAARAAVAVAMTAVVALAVAVAVVVAETVVGTGIGVGFALVAVIVAVAIAEPVIETLVFAGAATVIVTRVIAVTVVSTSACIGWRAVIGDEVQYFIRKIAIAIAAYRGTSFRGANLTDANFSGARLKSTDFRGAIVTRTCWRKTKMLNRVRPGTTYLQNTQVRQVLVTGIGQDKNFDRQDLRGVNFTGATLADASFIGADLSGANLQYADLCRAKLVQTQLDETDLTGATLTGAYIEDWGITNHTKLDGVRCEYVFMRLPTKLDPDPLRKPDNRNEKFEDGDFADFIKPIVDTLDLYHNQGVDPRAIAIAFKQLAENHPDAELRPVGMEVRGEDKFLLKAKTAPDADKSKLSAEYFEMYNQLKALAEQEVQKLLTEKDVRISSLETMVSTALQRSSFYSKTHIEKVGTMSHNPSNFSVGGSVGGDVNNVQGDHNRAVQGDNNQAVLGDSNQVTQRNQVGADNETSLTKDDVVKLLAELETLIQRAELPTNTKEEVTEDLSAAKKATDKEEPNKKRALDRLTTVAETLEKTTKTVDSGQKLWTAAKPIIVKVASWLGAAAGSHLLGL